MRSLFALLRSLLFAKTHSQEISREQFLDHSFLRALNIYSHKGIVVWTENKKGVRNIFYDIASNYYPVQFTTQDMGGKLKVHNGAE